MTPSGIALIFAPKGRASPRATGAVLHRACSSEVTIRRRGVIAARRSVLVRAFSSAAIVTLSNRITPAFAGPGARSNGKARNGCWLVDRSTPRTRNTARRWDFDGRDVLPLPIESRRTIQIKIVHTQPTPALTRPARPVRASTLFQNEAANLTRSLRCSVDPLPK
jgi:hypothetical protein